MAQKNRDKEVWLIPKRTNLHQSICLIDGIIKRNYDNKTWNGSKQNNLGVNLKNWGATSKGKNISNQSIRTLLASIPQYLGYVYIDTLTTPNVLRLTPAGKKIWENNHLKLQKIENLNKDKDKTIQESLDVLKQMEKLQITNPIILKDCENISVFPFRFLLKLLKRINYIDVEEMAYFLFRSKSEEDIDLVELEIKNFRKLSHDDRFILIDTFKKTHIGNITLVDAPSTNYFISLCLMTGIIEKVSVQPSNKLKKIKAIKIKESKISYVDQILTKYKNTSTYNFKNNLKLWIEYIGNTDRDFPPINFKIISNCKNILWTIEQNNRFIDGDITDMNYEYILPVFLYEDYTIKLYDTDSGNMIQCLNITIDDSINTFEINSNELPLNNKVEDPVSYLINEIKLHCESRNFSQTNLNKLKVIASITGNDKSNDNQLRGAYLEYYFYELLLELKRQNIIDDIIWNGKKGKYGLPVQAPGGRIGTPDIIFTIDDVDFVLELTTIKSKSQQFSAEASSVPDHIQLYNKETNQTVKGIFSAPQMHERNIMTMKSTLKSYGLDIICLTIDDLLDIFETKNRKIIFETLMDN